MLSSSVASSSFSRIIKTVTIRALRGCVISIPFDFVKEVIRQENLRLNGVGVVPEATTQYDSNGKCIE